MQAEELYREVDEELQREKLLALWRRYGKLVVLLVVVIVLAAGGYFGWRYYQQRQAEADALAYAAAQAQLQAGDQKGAGEAFARIASQGRSGYVALAALRNAQTKLATGDETGAITTLDQLAANRSVDDIFRAIATLSSVSLQLDTGDPAALKARLQPLIDAGGAWRFNAREMQALFDIRQNDLASASSILTDLAADSDAPQDLQSRAAELRDALAAKQNVAPAAPATE